MDKDEAQRADQFAKELSELGRKYGIGISDEPSTFVLEQDDYALDYYVDRDGRLRWK